MKEDNRNIRHKILDTALRHNSAVYQALIQMGWFREADADYLAPEYYAPIFLVFQRYFSCGEVSAEKLHKAAEELTIHLPNFYKKYNLF
ncbi:MAG: hypothetical protein Q8930_18240 [Bacillota bacterium]|nr:hypothetical protein [Bacillota bacterium]